MENAMAIGQHSSDDNNLLVKMSAELQDVLARVEMVLQKSSDLTEQISIRASRQRYLDEALEESRKLATEISNSAEERIHAVEARAQLIVAPQKAQISQLEMEIAELKRDLREEEPMPEVLTASSVYVTEPHIFTHAQIVPIPAHIDSPKPSYAQEIHMEASFSIDGTLALDIIPAFLAAPAVQVEYQELEIQDPVQLQNQPQCEEMEPEPTADQTADLIADNILPETAIPECVMGSTVDILCLETEITIQHNSPTKSWHRKKHSHHWQLMLQVEVPEVAAHAVHSHVLTMIVSTLAPYDDVLLNDVFPFDFVDPSDDKVAAYFFNLLEDNLLMKDLILKELIIFEGEAVITQLNARNAEMDDMLKGEDLIQQMRAKLLSKTVPADIPAKKRFGFFGRK